MSVPALSAKQARVAVEYGHHHLAGQTGRNLLSLLPQ